LSDTNASIAGIVCDGRDYLRKTNAANEKAG